MINYEDEKKLARSGSLKDRMALAKNPKTTPEILYFLAQDIDDLVRQAVANNNSTPRHADIILTKDSNIDIRGDLAVKLARITPHLPNDKRQKLYQLTEEALSVLARDQVLRVRQILSDALKDVPSAPHAIIRQLAGDNELTVAEPVLICSPVLSEKDLLQIISSDPIQGALIAIAQREKVSENVANIIIKKGDNAAVTYLLKNHKAVISEEDLDAVVSKAKTIEEWHAPIISRPLLPASSICRLATFVAMNLLDKLQSRLDLDDETLIAITQTIETRIAKESKEAALQEKNVDVETAAYDEAQKLMRAGALTQDLIEDALSDGNRSFVMAAVSLLADIDHEFVIKSLTCKKAEPIVTLCWKAGLSAHMAQQFQMQIARIPPQTIIAPLRESGKFALSEREMKTIADKMPVAI